MILDMRLTIRMHYSPLASGQGTASVASKDIHASLAVSNALLTLILFFSLAYVEMRLILARMIINFEMELAEPDFDWIDQKVYNLWEKPPLMLKLLPRDIAKSEKA